MNSFYIFNYYILRLKIVILIQYGECCGEMKLPFSLPLIKYILTRKMNKINFLF